MHRLGQRREVEVFRLTMQNSIEERVLALQEKKIKMASLALSEKLSAEHKQRQRLADLRDLMGIAAPARRVTNAAADGSATSTAP